jgi:hypothetical protein
MIIIHGTRLYGKVDQVPGLFFIATSFFYLQFIPLFPLGSFLVLEGTTKEGGGFSGRKLGWSGKSIFFAYFRLALFIGGCMWRRWPSSMPSRCWKEMAPLIGPPSAGCWQLQSFCSWLFGQVIALLMPGRRVPWNWQGKSASRRRPSPSFSRINWDRKTWMSCPSIFSTLEILATKAPPNWTLSNSLPETSPHTF